MNLKEKENYGSGHFRKWGYSSNLSKREFCSSSTGIAQKKKRGGKKTNGETETENMTDEMYLSPPPQM